MAQDASLRGAKVVQGGPKYLQRGQLPPPCPLPAPMIDYVVEKTTFVKLIL